MAGVKAKKFISAVKDVPREEFIGGGTFACAGCQAVLGIKYVLKALGKNTIMVNPSGCMTLTATYPFTPYKVPWVHNAIENADSTAAGIVSGLKRKKMDKKVTVVVYAGDGATYDIGFQALSGAAERQDNFIHVCYNNESFANTGFQKSSGSPKFARTSTTPPWRLIEGNPFPRKHMTKIMVAHDSPYVATASTAFPVDFMKKVQKAATIQGLKYIELLSPCIPGWMIGADQGMKAAKEMVEAGLWPLYEVENGKFSLSYKPNMNPVEKALKMQGRYRHLEKEEFAEIQKQVNEEWKKYLTGEFWTVNEY